jgi:two-component system NtrC family sensor kinase
VINLVANALQAMQGDGALILRVFPKTHDGRSGAALEVQDCGPGIPSEILGAVFDPFFTTKPGEGTGLGLSISQTLIQRAGGLITVRNGAEGGAVFTVWLPAADEDKAA